MSNPFDTTLKTLVDAHVAEWVAFLAPRAGLPVGPGRLLDTDLSASLQADRLIRVDGPAPFALHLEFQSSSELGVPARMLRYNVDAAWENKIPVASVLVLLRPSAAASDQTGVLDVSAGGAPPHLTFRYSVLRVWQESVESFLAAGPGLIPLSVLTNEAARNLDAAVERFRDRLQAPDIPANVAGTLAGLTFMLSGLRYDEDEFRRVYGMMDKILEDSKSYHWVLKKGEERGRAEGKAEGEAEGRLAEARRLLVRFATKHHGSPSAAVLAVLDDISDRDHLERMFDAVPDAAGWDDLLATP